MFERIMKCLEMMDEDNILTRIYNYNTFIKSIKNAERAVEEMSCSGISKKVIVILKPSWVLSYFEKRPYLKSFLRFLRMIHNLTLARPPSNCFPIFV